MTHSDDLWAKVRALRALADDIEICCDKANTASQGASWHCDNAAEVREAIRGFRGAAQRAAGNIREEANAVAGQARAAEAKERGDTHPAHGHLPSAS